MHTVPIFTTFYTISHKSCPPPTRGDATCSPCPPPPLVVLLVPIRRAPLVMLLPYLLVMPPFLSPC